MMSSSEFPSRDQQVGFLLKMQNLLTGGRFVSSYKFALLLAICDLSVELSCQADGELRIPLAKIAEKFITYYWLQVLPYPAGSGKPLLVLKQNTGRQAEIIGLVKEAHQAAGGSLPKAQSELRSWKRLVSSVRSVILDMPLWKLQWIGTSVDAFIYQQKVLQDDCIVLLPGVGGCLRNFHGLLSELGRGSWVTYIRQTNAASLEGDRDLSDFLFGAERSRLRAIAPLLLELQAGHCFYCQGLLRGTGDVDHFVPWSRYQIEFGHNFVLAHTSCNRDKSAWLPAENHLQAWVDRNLTHRDLLREQFREQGILADLGSSVEITRWAYESAAAVDDRLWKIKGELVPISGAWKGLLGPNLPLGMSTG
jgi:hypothetical protein